MKNVFLRIVMIGLSCLFLMNCANKVEKNIEKAKFALDEGDYSLAISSATKALSEEPNNATAARILASAYMGRGGFNMHDIAVEILSLDKESNNYRALAPVVPDDGDLNDLKLAIETLKGLTALNFDTFSADNVNTDELKNAAYDLGLMQIVYHYAIAILNTDFKVDPDNYDVTLLDDETTDDDFSDLVEAQTALIEFDDYLTAAGFSVDSEKGAFIFDVRQSHCLLQGAVNDEGYSLDTFRAMVFCNLSEDSTLEDPSAYDSHFSDCSFANPDDSGLSQEILDCYDVNTVLE